MIDPLLCEVNVTVNLIQLKVSSVMEINVDDMNTPEGKPLARRRELVMARQISMKLSKDYTKKSLAFIGSEHGGRDHATVLHACKAINNLLDANDSLITIPYLRSKKIIDTFIEQQILLSETKQENTIFNTEK
jgi:chromosomal replication initiation ATPase DnaA